MVEQFTAQTVQQDKNSNHVSQQSAKLRAIAISCYRLPAPGTERNRPNSVGLDKLAVVMVD